VNSFYYGSKGCIKNEILKNNVTGRTSQN